MRERVQREPGREGESRGTSSTISRPRRNGERHQQHRQSPTKHSSQQASDLASPPPPPWQHQATSHRRRRRRSSSSSCAPLESSCRCKRSTSPRQHASAVRAAAAARGARLEIASRNNPCLLRARGSPPACAGQGESSLPPGPIPPVSIRAHARHGRQWRGASRGAQWRRLTRRRGSRLVIRASVSSNSGAKPLAPCGNWGGPCWIKWASWGFSLSGALTRGEHVCSSGGLLMRVLCLVNVSLLCAWI